MRSIGIVLACLYATPALAQTAKSEPSILDRAVNQPGLRWTLYGPDQSAKPVATTGVPGDQAVRVTIKRKGANPWDVGALYPSSKPIGEGDTILVAVYLRAPDVPPGQPVTVPLGATASDAPYAAIASENVAVGPEWKIHYVSGTAPRAFAPGKARISVQLAGAKQVLELGPAFLLDFGKGYDPAKLPKN